MINSLIAPISLPTVRIAIRATLRRSYAPQAFSVQYSSGSLYKDGHRPERTNASSAGRPSLLFKPSQPPRVLPGISRSRISLETNMTSDNIFSRSDRAKTLEIARVSLETRIHSPSESIRWTIPSGESALCTRVKDHSS